MALEFRQSVLAACLTAAVPVLAETPGKPLSAAAIAAHWSYRFAGDGGLVAMDLGCSKAGHWRAAGRKLCLEFEEKGVRVPIATSYGVPARRSFSSATA